MIKVCVCGYGKMGSTIVNFIKKEKDMKLIAIIEAKDNPNIGKYVDNVKITDDLEKVIKNVDTIVEFTNPFATLEHVKVAVKYNVPMVIGTTGYSKKQYNELIKYCKKIPSVISPNMSVGINVLISILPQIRKMLNGYDIEIIEAHHKLKKDAPSGTAKKLKEVINENVPIHSIRAGDIFGDHIIIFAGNGERIEIKHQVHTRDVFAKGAILAIRFISKSKKGIYTMSDVLKVMD
jgi:4-hydroxy-tetrahydrodipicolinate reductase